MAGDGDSGISRRRSGSVRISRPSRFEIKRHSPACHAFDCLDDLHDRMPLAGAEIELRALAAIEEIGEGARMGAGEVGYVNVIADACPVGRRIVVAEDAQTFDRAGRRHEGARYQVGLGFVAFAKLPVGVGAAGIEVTQQQVGQVVNFGEIPDDLLRHQFAAAVRTQRIGLALFRNRDLCRYAVDRAAAGEDDPANA